MRYSFFSTVLYRLIRSKIYLRIERFLRAKKNQRIFREKNPDKTIDPKLKSWWTGVRDEYRGLTEEEIKVRFRSGCFPGAILMSHVHGDFNIATVIRSANSFGITDVFYLGKKKIDKRGAVGSMNYMNITHLTSLSELNKLKEKYFLVALEQDSRSVPLASFDFPPNTMLLLGEEKSGLSKEILDLVDAVVEIPMHGTIRSLNAGCAASIALHAYVNSVQSKK